MSFLDPSFPLAKVTLVTDPGRAGGFGRMVGTSLYSPDEPVSCERSIGPFQLPVQGKTGSRTLGEQVRGRAGACARACLPVIAGTGFLVPNASEFDRNETSGKCGTGKRVLGRRDEGQNLEKTGKDGPEVNAAALLAARGLLF